MDWLHLEMPFVLSLLPSFYAAFTLLRPICCRSALFLLFVLSPLAGGRRKSIFISDTSEKNED